VLLRERKRADRSQQPLVLLIVTINDAQRDERAMWSSALDAATSATRETDIVGWLRTDAVLGIVLTEVKTAELGPIQHVRRRIRRELLKRLPVEQMDRFSLRSYVYPDPAAATTEGASVEPLLEGITVRKSAITAYDVAKRTMDLLASTALLAALSPLMLLIAALIKLKSRGPVLFKQLRVGQRAQPFHMLKFRSMHVNNDDRIHQAFVSDLIKAATPASGVFKIVDDLDPAGNHDVERHVGLPGPEDRLAVAPALPPGPGARADLFEVGVAQRGEGDGGQLGGSGHDRPGRSPRSRASRRA